MCLFAGLKHFLASPFVKRNSGVQCIHNHIYSAKRGCQDLMCSYVSAWLLLSHHCQTMDDLCMPVREHKSLNKTNFFNVIFKNKQYRTLYLASFLGIYIQILKQGNICIPILINN